MTGRSVGVDVGGTFTDLVAVAEDGSVESRKVSSTPDDQSRGVLDVLAALGAPSSEVSRLVHGTTVATNMLLERTGARVVLCATEGATDLPVLRRQERAALYDLARHHPEPLVPRSLTVSVPERMSPRGVERELAERTSLELSKAVADLQPDTVAVSLLHSYAHPRHERMLGSSLLERFGGENVVLSCDTLPEIREYERTATTIAEAYLRPGVNRYLRSLAERMLSAGYPSPAVMTSTGGMRDAASASRSAAALALSGPAGGVVGAAHVAVMAGFANALTIDIGGTSADAGVVLDGEPLSEAGGDVANVPIALPRVLVETVSAGGGSIGWIDEGGALRVGPRSAGAVPGPAAFGRGGTQATVTDAHLVLRHVEEARFSGGVSLDSSLAHAAIERLALQLGVSAERTARAMIAAADASMARALRRVSVERGVDPRRCVLVALGGGGPLHGCGLADHLGIATILVPPLAGVLSALGLAIAPERRESLASVMMLACELDALAVHNILDGVSRSANAEHAVTRQWRLRCRYEGQGHELETPVEPGNDGAHVARTFAAIHDARFGFTLEREVEVVSVRHAATGSRHEVRLARAGAHPWVKPWTDAGGTLEATVRGPDTIALADATLLVSDGWTARALPMGGWLVERNS